MRKPLLVLALVLLASRVAAQESVATAADAAWQFDTSG